MLQHGQTLRPSCDVKSALHERTKAVRCHLDEVPRGVTFIETDSGMVAGGVGAEEELVLNGDRVEVCKMESSGDWLCND